MKVGKRCLAVFLVLLIGVFFVGALVVSNPGHGSGHVNFKLEESDMTLQAAIENNLLINLPVLFSIVSAVNNGHSAEEIWVSVNGVERKLSESIVVPKGLCSTSTNAYSESLDPGHFASEIAVNVDGVDMTFQAAIDMGKFCVEWETGGCSADCGPGSRSVSCQKGDGTVVSDDLCLEAKPTTSCNNGDCVPALTYSCQKQDYIKCCDMNWANCYSCSGKGPGERDTWVCKAETYSSPCVDDPVC